MRRLPCGVVSARGWLVHCWGDAWGVTCPGVPLVASLKHSSCWVSCQCSPCYAPQMGEDHLLCWTGASKEQAAPVHQARRSLRHEQAKMHMQSCMTCRLVAMCLLNARIAAWDS